MAGVLRDRRAQLYDFAECYSIPSREKAAVEPDGPAKVVPAHGRLGPLGITLSGEKRFLGFVETDTENEKVLTPFLRSLLARGLDSS